MNTFFGRRPRHIAKFDNPITEFMFVQDMLVQTYEQDEPQLPRALEPVRPMFERIEHLGRPPREFTYLSVKRQPLGGGSSFSRPGWHIDGYLTSDITFIYSDIFPTEYSVSAFALDLDHRTSIAQMEEQAHPMDVRTMEERALVELPLTCVHRVHVPEVPHTRTFVKIVYSNRSFNLEGNAINPLLPAPWPFHPRAVAVNNDSRNHDSHNDPSKGA